MKLHFALLLLLLLLQTLAVHSAVLKSLSRSSNSGLRSVVSRQLAELDTSVPANTICPAKRRRKLPKKKIFQILLRRLSIPRNCLVHSITANSHIVKGKTARSQVASVARSRGLPASVVNKLKAIAFTRSVVFQTFTFVVDTRVRNGRFETYVGAARRAGSNDVEFGVIKGVAVGKLEKKTTPVRRKKCKRRFFVKRCRKWTDQVPRGNTANELRSIERALRHRAVAMMKKKLGHIARRVARAADFQEISARDSLRNCVSSFLENAALPGNESFANSSASLMRQVQRGFDAMEKFSVTNVLPELPVAMATKVAQFLLPLLRLTPRIAEVLKTELFGKLPQQPQHRWVVTSVMTTSATGDNSSAVNQIAIFTRLRSHQFDLAYAKSRIFTEVAPAAALVQQGGCSHQRQVLMYQLPHALHLRDLVETGRFLETFSCKFFLTTELQSV